VNAGGRRAILASVLLGESLLAFFLLFQRSPVSGDDYAYLFQAELFVSGKLYAESPLYSATHPLHDCVLTKCLTDHQGKRFSKYPPGASALLAIGVPLHAPWLVDPILAALAVYLFLAHVGARHGPEPERACGTLLVLNGFLVYYAASYRPHVATMLGVFAAFLLFEGTDSRSPRAGIRLLGSGALLGATTLFRYLDFVPLAVWITLCLVRRRRVRHLLLFGAGFVLLAAGNLLYDQLLSGDPFTTPTRLYGAAGIHDRLALSWRGFVVTGARLLTLAAVFPPVLLLLAFWRRHPPSPAARRGLALFGMSVALYFFYPAAVGGPGPRYLLAYFPFLVLAVVDRQSQLKARDPGSARRFWAAAVCVQVVSSLTFLALEGYTLYGRRNLERTLAARHGEGRQLVLLKTGTYSTAAGDLTRNPPDLTSADTLIFLWCDAPKREALLRIFPGRTVWEYEYPGRLTAYRGSESGEPAAAAPAQPEAKADPSAAKR
jgi:hypothetical protein